MYVLGAAVVVVGKVGWCPSCVGLTRAVGVGCGMTGITGVVPDTCWEDEHWDWDGVVLGAAGWCCWGSAWGRVWWRGNIPGALSSECRLIPPEDRKKELTKEHRRFS